MPSSGLPAAARAASHAMIDGIPYHVGQWIAEAF